MDEFAQQWEKFQRRAQGLTLEPRQSAESPAGAEQKVEPDIGNRSIDGPEIYTVGTLVNEDQQDIDASIDTLLEGASKYEFSESCIELKTVEEVSGQQLEESGAGEGVAGNNADAALPLAATETAPSTEPVHPQPLPELKACPNEPQLLLCAQPMTAEAAAEAEKKNDHTTLRIVPLSAMLAYSLEDRSERLFEVSIVAEMIANLLSQSFVNILSDCLLATSPSLAVIAESAIRDAVPSLLQMKAGKITEKTVNI